MLIDDRLRQPLGLAPEHQHGIEGIGGLIKTARAEFLEQKQLIGARLPRGQKCLPRGKFRQPHMRPIIQPRPLDPLVRKIKPQRMDQHQLHIQGHTGAPHRAGVAGNFGVDEDDGGAGQFSFRPLGAALSSLFFHVFSIWQTSSRGIAGETSCRIEKVKFTGSRSFSNLFPP